MRSSGLFKRPRLYIGRSRRELVVECGTLLDVAYCNVGDDESDWIFVSAGGPIHPRLMAESTTVARTASASNL